MSAIPDLPEFLAKHLAAIAKRESFEQYTVEHKSGSNFGDGFMGELLAITLRGKRSSKDGQSADESLALICKLPPQNEARQEEFQAATVFAQEVLMYNRILPIMERLQQEFEIEPKDRFSAYPRCYVAEHNAKEPHKSVIIMEDLGVAGFRMWDKHHVTTEANMRLFLQQLGRFHGMSFVLRDRRPEVFAQIEAIPDDMMPVLENSGWQPMFEAAFDRSVVVLAEDEPNAATMRLMRQKFISLLKNAFDAKLVGPSAVWGHGDCWNNNMMFKFDGDTPTAICMLDFQICHMSSPAADLTSLLLTATEKPMRAAHMSEFLQFYYDSVAAIIRAFGSDPDRLFSRADFEQQLQRFGYYGVLMSVMILPIMLAQPDEIVDMNDIAASAQAGDESGPKVMTRMTERMAEAYRTRLADAMNDARDYGWFTGLE